MTCPTEPLRGGAHRRRAYQGLVEPHRGELHAHCYRMLGSVQDAEDALQDGDAPRVARPAAVQGRSSLRSWLYKITTNACLDAIARRPKRVLPIDYGPPADPHDDIAKPLVESVWIEPYPDELARSSATGCSAPRRATSSARAWSWRSWRRSSTCRRSSAPS